MPPHDLLVRVGQICLEQRQQLETPGAEKVKVLMGATCVCPQLLACSQLGEKLAGQVWLSPAQGPP